MRARLVFVSFAIVACSIQAQQAPAARQGDAARIGPLQRRGHVAPGVGGVPAGLPPPTPIQARTIAEVKAFEQACDEAAVRGDTAFLGTALANDFVMTHGDGWVTGNSPFKVDTKQTWMEYVGRKPSPYFYRKLDGVQVELHGDVAITIGKYRYLPRTNSESGSTAAMGTHLYVWFERVYVKREGHWQFLSHRTVNGPGREYDSSGTESVPRQ